MCGAAALWRVSHKPQSPRIVSATAAQFACAYPAVVCCTVQGTRPGMHAQLAARGNLFRMCATLQAARWAARRPPDPRPFRHARTCACKLTFPPVPYAGSQASALALLAVTSDQGLPSMRQPSSSTTGTRRRRGRPGRPGRCQALARHAKSAKWTDAHPEAPFGTRSGALLSSARWESTLLALCADCAPAAGAQ